MTIDSMLSQVAEIGASDLHIQAGQPPVMRHNGVLAPMPGRPVLNENIIGQLFSSILGPEVQDAYRQKSSVDFSHGVEGVARFRVNLFVQKGRLAGAFRRIPEAIPNLEELKAPAVLANFAKASRGIVLVTGPTGSGKSTTLAAVMRLINETRREHILTIEDPIEFVHTAQNCLITQREVGRDCPTFAQGLKDSLRQDPDVILVGEMRDIETMRIAMTAAETGHLVFATLHTSSAPSAVDRIIDAFPASEQQQIRTMLAGSLLGVVTQALLPTADGKGRVAAHEIMVAINSVKALIRSGKSEQLRNELQTKSQHGMQTLDKALAYFVSTGQITEELALERSQSVSELTQLLARARSGQALPAPELLGLG